MTTLNILNAFQLGEFHLELESLGRPLSHGKLQTVPRPQEVQNCLVLYGFPFLFWGWQDPTLLVVLLCAWVGPVGHLRGKGTPAALASSFSIPNGRSEDKENTTVASVPSLTPAARETFVLETKAKKNAPSLLSVQRRLEASQGLLCGSQCLPVLRTCSQSEQDTVDLFRKAEGTRYLFKKPFSSPCTLVSLRPTPHISQFCSSSFPPCITCA